MIPKADTLCPQDLYGLGFFVETVVKSAVIRDSYFKVQDALVPQLVDEGGQDEREEEYTQRISLRCALK